VLRWENYTNLGVRSQPEQQSKTLSQIKQNTRGRKNKRKKRERIEKRRRSRR
jgi:hypothetical protein